jgi:protein O-mannosyl-transferase
MSLPDLPSRGARAAVVCGFFIVAVFVYGASLHNGFVNWDDGLLIYQNPAVMEASWTSIKHAFTTYDPELYIPLTLLSYQIDYQLGGGAAFTFHLQNLILHAFNALLIAWLAFLLLKNRLAALCIGLAFLVHPLHTEAVAWASGRKDVLAAFFFLGALLSFLYYRSEGSKKLYWTSVILFLCALLSKVIAVTLPVVLLLFMFREHGKFKKQDFIDILPHVVLSVIFGIVAILGKTEVSAASSLSDKILMAISSSVFYLGKIFVPINFSVLYPYPDNITLASPDFYLPAIALVALIGLAVYSLRHTRDIAAWFAFYLITLAPTFINISRGKDDAYSASDRYAYIPSIGILLIVGYVLTLLLEQPSSIRAKAIRMKAVLGVGGVTLVLLAALAAGQSLVWRDTKSLFEHAIAHAPSPSYVAYNNVANAYRGEKNYDKAVEYFNKSIEIRPHPKTYSNLGATYRRMGNSALAIDAYRRALELDPENGLAFFGLGIVFAEQGRDQDAFNVYKRALDIDPNSAEVYTNIGVLRARRGEIPEAIAAYQKAIEAEPYFPDAYYNLAVIYTQQGKYDEAITAYEQAIDLNPRSIPARINLGLLYSSKAQTDKSIEQFKAILKYDPDNAAALSALKQLGALK